jgi:hypothetical protein
LLAALILSESLQNLVILLSSKSGSHIKMVKKTDRGDHIIIIPFRKEQQKRTLNNILPDIANHNNMTKQEIINLFH